MPIKANPVYTKDTVSREKKGHKIEDKRISVCTDCETGIFPHHEYVWTNRGLVHKGCNEAASTT